MGWGIVPCTEALQVQFPVRHVSSLRVCSPVGAQKGGNQWMFLCFPPSLPFSLYKSNRKKNPLCRKHLRGTWTGVFRYANYFSRCQDIFSLFWIPATKTGKQVSLEGTRQQVLEVLLLFIGKGSTGPLQLVIHHGSPPGRGGRNSPAVLPGSELQGRFESSLLSPEFPALL